MERGAEAVDRRGGFCAGRIGLRGCPAHGCRARADLSMAARSAERCGGVCGGGGRAGAGGENGGRAQRLEIELGRDIRVRIAATAPKELASAIIKALVAR